MRVTVPPSLRNSWNERDSEINATVFNQSTSGVGSLLFETLTIPADKRCHIHQISYFGVVTTAPSAPSGVSYEIEFRPKGIPSSSSVYNNIYVTSLYDRCDFVLNADIFLNPTDEVKLRRVISDGSLVILLAAGILYTLYDV